MAIAGAYMAFDTIVQVLDRILQRSASRREQQTGRELA